MCSPSNDQDPMMTFLLSNVKCAKSTSLEKSPIVLLLQGTAQTPSLQGPLFSPKERIPPASSLLNSSCLLPPESPFICSASHALEALCLFCLSPCNDLEQTSLWPKHQAWVHGDPRMGAGPASQRTEEGPVGREAGSEGQVSGATPVPQGSYKWN